MGGDGGAMSDLPDYGNQDMVGRIGTTANVGVSKPTASTYYTKGMTYPLLVGKKRINIDPAEEHTKVVCLKGCLNKALLDQDGYYGEILEDMEKQLGKFGMMRRLRVVRPGDGVGADGVGVVFAHYEDIEGAILAKNTLKNTKFDGKLVETGFYSEESFEQGRFG